MKLNMEEKIIEIIISRKNYRIKNVFIQECVEIGRKNNRIWKEIKYPKKHSNENYNSSMLNNKNFLNKQICPVETHFSVKVLVCISKGTVSYKGYFCYTWFF